MKTGAMLSPCGTFRYHLYRAWADGASLLFVMLNPSTATANENDPTIRRCIRFGRDLGFAGIEVVNLFAYRTSSPRELRDNGYQVGPLNDRWIQGCTETIVAEGGEVVVAWGAPGAGLARRVDVLRLIERAGGRAMCLGRTKLGEPRHPLMLAASCRLEPFLE